MFYQVLLITNMFRSLLGPSQEQLCNSATNTTNCQIIYVEPLNAILNTSNSQYDHKLSAHRQLKSNKI
jgi:hypothetical protein